jgi:hypothetical protein
MNTLEINLNDLTIWELNDLLEFFDKLGKEDYVRFISNYLTNIDYES